MPGVCRIGDSFSGVCTAHTTPQAFTGVWTTSSSIATADGLKIILVGDQAPTSCGHIAQASTGSSILTDTTKAIHRVGDVIIVTGGGSGSGTSTSGSSVITSN